MNPPNSPDAAGRETSSHQSRWFWIIVAGSLLIVLIALLLPREGNEPTTDNASSDTPGAGTTPNSRGVDRSRRLARATRFASAPTAEENVAGKVKRFASSRREIVRAIARHSNKDVPSEVEKFFDALEGGDWEEIDGLWKGMAKRSGQYEGSTHSPELNEFWPAVLEAYGTAEQAHLWPAQKLLDYGEAVLGSLRPGMVYVGGTDEGRFIPTLLNETSGGEKHIVVTQNALADGRYLDYLSFLYRDRFATLTKEDWQGAFKDYLDDAQKRLQHDQQFPDEPKQIRLGEDIRITDGKVQVSGQVAVMSINERLLRTLMEKNPDLPFALQESFSLKSTYATAAPLGPIMELGVGDGQTPFTAERAGQSVDYWRTTAQQLLSDPEVPEGSDARKSYASGSILNNGPRWKRFAEPSLTLLFGRLPIP